MRNFNDIPRGTNVTVVPFVGGHSEEIVHWLEEFNVTGWQICDARTVWLSLGVDYPLVRQLPVVPEYPEQTMTDDVLYFVSFYDAGAVQAWISEMLDSDENVDWCNEKARIAAKHYAYDQAFARDPGPFDFRRCL